jgi:hypothetical protein
MYCLSVLYLLPNQRAYNPMHLDHCLTVGNSLFESYPCVLGQFE